LTRARPRNAASLICLAAFLSLAACTQTPVAPPESAPLEEAPLVVSLDPAEARDLVSDYRRAHGLSQVSLDSTLMHLAQNQADAMAKVNVLSHDISGPLTRRLAAAHLSQATAVENVSAGYFTMPRAFAGWQHSPPHNANLLDPAMRRMGIAFAAAPGTRFKVYWALVMTN
jgi:uncharacterized protein YkwD